MIKLSESEFDTKNFEEVLPKEVIKFHYQNYNIMARRWKISYLSSKDGYRVEFGQIYRRPKTLLGWLKISGQLLKKACKL